MYSSTQYTLIFPAVNPVEVRLNLEDEQALHKQNLHIHTEQFRFEYHNISPAEAPRHVPAFQPILQYLQTVRSTTTLPAAHPPIVQITEENTSCHVEFIDTQAKTILLTCPFEKKDWANLEELLLTQGLQLYHIQEVKKTVYEIPRLSAVYELIHRPRIEPYLKIITQNRKRLPEVVACAGFYMGDARNITEEELLQAATHTKLQIFE